MAEHYHAENRTVLGWQGGLRLDLVGGDHRHADAFAALLELLELSGIGKYTAQGFGSVRVDTVTSGQLSAEVAAPSSRRAPHRASRRSQHRLSDARPRAVAEAEEFGGTLFD